MTARWAVRTQVANGNFCDTSRSETLQDPARSESCLPKGKVVRPFSFQSFGQAFSKAYAVEVAEASSSFLTYPACPQNATIMFSPPKIHEKRSSAHNI